MNKKSIYVLPLLLMISFSTGVFLQFITKDQVSFSTESITFGAAFLSACKNDLIIVLPWLIFFQKPFLPPLLSLLITGKVFALGFSASYLMASHSQGISILCTMFLPRCIIKVPAYFCMILLLLTKQHQRPSYKAVQLTKEQCLCIAALLLSNLIEAVLLSTFVLP